MPINFGLLCPAVPDKVFPTVYTYSGGCENRCGAPLARMLQEDEVPQWNGHVLAHSGHRGHRVVLLEHADLQAVVGRVPGLNAHQFHRVAVLGHRLIKLAKSSN